jgi:hypothetical protein
MEILQDTLKFFEEFPIKSETITKKIILFMVEESNSFSVPVSIVFWKETENEPNQLSKYITYILKDFRTFDGVNKILEKHNINFRFITENIRGRVLLYFKGKDELEFDEDLLKEIESISL